MAENSRLMMFVFIYLFQTVLYHYYKRRLLNGTKILKLWVSLGLFLILPQASLSSSLLHVISSVRRPIFDFFLIE